MYIKLTRRGKEKKKSQQRKQSTVLGEGQKRYTANLLAK